MKIGEPVNSIPNGGGNESYAGLYAAISAVGAGFLPIEFVDQKELRRVYNALRQNGRYTIRRRGLVLYATRKVQP